MSEQKQSGFCNACQRQVLVTRPGANHILHLLLTLVTFGFWLIVWIAATIGANGNSWRCSICGSLTASAGQFQPR